MKYLLIITLVLFTGCNIGTSGKQVDGGSTNQLNALFEPDFYYELDTWGSNADVFEFTPKSNPNYTCIAVGLKRMDCIPKAL
jgi:hypothetical protein